LGVGGGTDEGAERDRWFRPMKVSALEARIQASEGGVFQLGAKELNVTGVQTLLDDHFGGTLTVTSVQAGADGLSLEGSGTVDSLQGRPVRLGFSTDATDVTGLLFSIEASGWSIDTSFLKFDGSYLQGKPFTALTLVLSARPEDGTEGTPGAGIGLLAPLDGTTFLYHGLLPATELTQQRSDIPLTAEFTDVRVRLDLLPQLAVGSSFQGVLPSSVPIADEFELRSASFVVHPALEVLGTVGIEIRSSDPWVLVQDKFEFEYVDVSFVVASPDAVHWAISSLMSIGGSVHVLAVIDSQLDLSVGLDDPVPIQPILDRYAPAVDLDVTVDSLRIDVGLGAKPPAWDLHLVVGTDWEIFQGVALKGFALGLDGAGTKLSTFAIASDVKLGDAKLHLGAELNRGAGWDFWGAMTHDYNVDLVPNDPMSSGSSGSLLKAVPAHRDTSHFFAEIFDKLFPGGGSSGVPAILDVEVKTLEVAFNTQTKDFHFDTTLEFGSDVETVLTFSRLHQEGASATTFEKRATGVIKVFPGTKDELDFELGVSLDPTSRHFVAAFDNPNGKPLPLDKLVQAMFPDSTVSPPPFQITVTDAIVGYVSDGSSSQSVFGIDLGAAIDLSSLGDLPIVGKELSAEKSLKLAVQIVYPAVGAGGKLEKADVQALNGLLPDAGPRFPEEDLTGLLTKVELRLGDGDPIDFSLPVKLNQSSGQLEKGGGSPDLSAPGSEATDDGVKWMRLNKKFGPVHLQRVGFRFDSSSEEVTALLDGGLTALGLEVDLMGLSVTTKVTDVHEFDPKFGLNGLGIRFAKGGVEIAGAFLHLGGEYDGLATVEAETLRLSAIGSLATVNGEPSLFIYAVLDFPLGGVPAFYVTGLAAGFGLNRQLVMPAVDQVKSFPLVAEAMDPPTVPTDAGGAGSFIAQEMGVLHEHLLPRIGQYFVCAGVRFSSFELLDSFVLVNVSFGRHFELDLLGMSTLVVPPKAGSSPALAVVSLQIAASFLPDEGVTIVQGQLTKDSYILDPNCHLTGGFAFAVWFGPNPHAGDFVVTLGGYHPDFEPPSYYPTVPRVGINWKLSSELSVVGGLYFALTPRAMMAGGALHATFQTSLDVGIASVDVKAWFLLGADFIVYWKPFRYDAKIYIDIGVDVVVHFLGTHHLGLDAGAALHVWGSPFGGHAHVHFKVIGIKVGFDVDFGAQAPSPPPLLWDSTDASESFRKSFLPPDAEIASITIAAGLVRKVDHGSSKTKLAATPGAAAAPQPEDAWHVIDPKDFVLHTTSVVPTKTLETKIAWAQGASGLSDFDCATDFGIASMAKNSQQVETFHQISVTRDGQGAETEFLVRPIKADVPGGLWAEENSDDVNAQALIEDAAHGFEIVPAKEPTPGHTKPIDRSLLAYTTLVMGEAWEDDANQSFSRTVVDPGDDPAANEAVWKRIQSEIHDNPTRDAVLAATGFGSEDVDIGESFLVDTAYAPAYGALQ